MQEVLAWDLYWPHPVGRTYHTICNVALARATAQATLQRGVVVLSLWRELPYIQWDTTFYMALARAVTQQGVMTCFMS